MVIGTAAGATIDYYQEVEGNGVGTEVHSVPLIPNHIYWGVKRSLYPDKRGEALRGVHLPIPRKVQGG